MRFPTLRYGNPNEFAFYCQGIPIKDIAKRLRRSERSVRNWLNFQEKMPWWVPELMRLQKMECDHRMYQMGMAPVRAKLGLVQKEAALYQFPDKEPLLVAADVPRDLHTMDLFSIANVA